MLKIDDLYKRFKEANFNVIDGVSLTINRGEVVGVIGKKRRR